VTDAIEDDEPVKSAAIESFCATLRELIDDLRATQSAEMSPGIAAAAIESFERALRALEPSPDQEQP